MNENDLCTSFRELSGMVTALEVAVKAMIIAHPDRKRLARIWRIWLPEQIDSFMKHPSYAVAVQREAIHRLLAELGEFIEMELPGEESDGDDE